MCATKVVFPPNLWTNKQLWTGLVTPRFLNSQPNCEHYQPFLIYGNPKLLIVKYLWVGNKSWKWKTPILLSVQSYEFCMVMHCLLPRRKSWLLCVSFLKKHLVWCVVTQGFFLEYFKVYSKHMSQLPMVNYWLKVLKLRSLCKRKHIIQLICQWSNWRTIWRQ